MSTCGRIESLNQLEKFRSDAAFMEGQSGDRISLMHIDEYLSIKDEIAAMLSMKCEGHVSSSIVDLSDQKGQIYLNLKSLVGTVGKIDIMRKHFSVKQSFYGIGWQQEDTDVCRSQIVEVTDKLLETIDEKLALYQLKKINVKFRIHYADEILETILCHIEDHNKHVTNNYDLLTPYTNMIRIHDFRYLMIWFAHANVRYNKNKSIELSNKTTEGNGM